MTWLDQLPTHWTAASLRWMSKRYAGGTPDKGNEAYWEDGEIPWINSGAVNDGYITEASELITREGFANSSAKWIPKGALVMALAGQGKTKGMVAQLGIPTTCNQSMAALIPDHRFEPRYLYYWLTANYQNIRNMAGGEARDGLNLEMLGSIPCPVPPVDEQQTIARFLDAKTAQIDALVAQKRLLITKLKEKRSALIARTVTRGLPPEAAKAAGLEPNPEMKDSGVDWLAQIPTHWRLRPLKRIVSIPITDGPHETPEFPLDGVPFVSAEAVKDGRVLLSSMRGYISREDHERYSRKYFPRKRDIFIVKSGSTTGKVAIVDFDDEFNVWSPLAAVRCDLWKALPEFVFYALSSEYFQGLVQVSWSFGTQPNIGMGVIGNLAVVLPPIFEQRLIAEFLGTEVARMNSLIDQAQTAIDRLTEYRQALITSAVTGKIDVRELA
ncbi:MAG TPA: restriction endonuclease subunit S [Burkholderiaceae bacterium]|nr:restriction endonuclease subunit S [Burkholderiaceae bacterium]